MGLEGLGKDDLKRVLEIRSAIGDVKSAITAGNAELKKLGQSFTNLNTEVNKVASEAKSFAELQDKAAESAKATTEAIKKEAQQLSIVRTLNLEINNLTNRAIGANEKNAKALLDQARRLGSAKDSAQELANEFGKLASSSSQLDSNTMWFTGFSEFVSDIPGLRALSGPFQDAAKASRETLINNAKVGALQDQIADKVGNIGDIQKLDGRTLTKEKLKQMGLDNITDGLTKNAAKEKLTSTLQANKSASSGIAGLKAGFKGLRGVISKAFVPLAIIQTVVSAIKFVVSLMTAASKQTAKFSNDLLISRESARELKIATHDIVEDFNGMSKAAGGVAITQEALLKTMSAINQKLGFQLNLMKDFGDEMGQNVAEATMMSEKFGLSADASARLFLESVKVGKPLKEMTKEYFGQVGFLSAQEGLTADVTGNLEEATKVSGNLRANFRGSSFAIAEGIFNAKRLGFELAQMEGVSSSLLNFQSSIEDEMAAELLTGKQLNLEKAREFALMGQTEKLMEEISKQAGTQEEFLSMNIIQRQALAKAVGMEVNELADMYDKRAKNDALAAENLKVQAKLRAANIKLQYDENGAIIGGLQEILIASKSVGKSEEEIREILGDQIYLRKSEQSATEKFNEAIARAKDIFASFVDGGLLDDLAAGLESFINGPLRLFMSREAKDKMDERKREREAKERASRAKSEGISVEQTYENDRRRASSPMDNKGGITYTPSNVDNVEDFILRPGQKPIKYGKGDLLVGGTNLGGGNNSNVETILTKLLVAVENGGDVYMDGNKVGKSLAIANSRMG